MIPSSPHEASRVIADEMDFDETVVKDILKRFVEVIKDSLKKEVPFCINSLCKIYFRYDNLENLIDEAERAHPYYKDKIRKKAVFEITGPVRAELNGWVHDLGMKNNKLETLRSLNIKPDEIHKIRKKKLLENQRQLGFRSELLFDEENLVHHDKMRQSELGEPPTIGEIEDMISVLNSEK